MFKNGASCLLRSQNGESKLDSAGTDSRQFEELMTGKPGGRDSPKLRTASARSGGTYFDKSSIASSAARRVINRAIACSRTASSTSRERSSVRRASSTMADCVAAVNKGRSNRTCNHSPAVSAATTECSGP